MNKQLIAGIVAAVSGVYLLWQYQTPVENVAVHDSYKILVRHFPYLKSRQIVWWEANKFMAQANTGFLTNTVMVDIVLELSTYRIDRGTDLDSNLLCFDEMSVDER